MQLPPRQLPNHQQRCTLAAHNGVKVTLCSAGNVEPVLVLGTMITALILVDGVVCGSTNVAASSSDSALGQLEMIYRALGRKGHQHSLRKTRTTDITKPLGSSGNCRACLVSSRRAVRHVGSLALRSSHTLTGLEVSKNAWHPGLVGAHDGMSSSWYAG